MSDTAATYWENRYSSGGCSGAGSRGEHAASKAEAISRFMREHQIRSLVDWGCGDGYLAGLLDLAGVDYCGVDVSRTAVGFGLERHSEHQFIKWNPTSRVDVDVRAELALSVDVLFHLVDDEIYQRYMGKVFGSASRFVVVYAPSKPADPRNASHMRFREWMLDVPPDWRSMDKPVDEAGPWCFDRG